MRRVILVLAILLLSSPSVLAQKLEVKTFKPELNDPAATQYAVKDYNGQNCALIIVGLAVDNIEFEGNIIKQERKENGEYWVYITDGSKNFQINSKDYLPEPVNFNSFGITSVESGRTYRMFVEHPNLEKSFDEILGIAKDYYNDYSSHTESSYYDAARIAYDNAIKHSDCPHDLIATLRAESDTMASIRRTTLLIEKAETAAKKAEAEKGFNSAEVYKYLSGELRFINRLLKYHPEITGLQSLRNNVIKRSQEHPEGKEKDGEETIIHQRETLSGKVSFKNEYAAIPFNRMKVYASTSPKIQDAKSSIIGKVNEDGTYSVVKPVGMSPLYIYVTGEKNDAHYVPTGTTTLDIVIKTSMF